MATVGGNRFKRGAASAPETATEGERAPACEIEQERNRLREENRRLRAALDQQERLHRETQALARVGGWEMSVDSGDVALTDEIYRIYGLDPSQGPPAVAEGITFYDEADRLRLEAAIEQASADGTPWDLEVSLTNKRGERRRCISRGRVVTRDGRPAVLYGALQDITDQHARIREVAELTERLTLATESLKLGVWEFNVADGSLVWDERMLELYGIERSAFCGTYDSWANGVHPDDLDRAARDVERSLETRRPFHSIFRVVRPNGEIRCIEANAKVLVDPDGQPVKMLGVNQDVTDRERVNVELRRASNLESLGALAGGIAHDFNNLLSASLANVQTLRHSVEDDPEALEAVDDLVEAAGRARDLTNQLTTFAKGGAPAKEVIALAKLAGDAAAVGLRGSRVRLEITGDVGDDEILGDPAQIQQLFQSLAVNAREAMPSGGVLTLELARVTIDASDSLAAGDYLSATLRDTGCGVPDDVRDRVLDPFFTTKPGKRGLGLAVAQSVAARHDGALTLETEVGVGTAVTVLLPFAKARRISRPIVAAVPERTPSVLVVDDEALVRRSLRRVLRRAGYQVDEAADQAEAVDFVGRKRAAGDYYDAVVMDLTIPGSPPGEDIAAQLRGIDARPRFIVSSGYSDSPVMARYREHGFDARVAKPVAPEKLLEEVAKAAGTRRSATSHRA